MLLSSCSGYQKLMKNGTNQEKFDKSVQYFEETDYYRAIQLIEQIQSYYRGTEKAQKLSYMHAYSYYHQGDYILSSYYFKQFAKNYPSSKEAEECYFMNAYCKYLDSPKYSLDQTNTQEALNELQLFINVYSSSERVTRCNELMDELRAKLEKKAFEIAALYLKMEEYQAAVASFENILKDYPGTEYKEEVQFSILRAYYQYARKSIQEKKIERYELAINAYDALMANFPETSHQKEAISIYNNASKDLKRFDKK